MPPLITGVMEEMDIDDPQIASCKIREELEQFIAAHVEESSKILKFFVGKPAKDFEDYEMVFETVIAQAARENNK